MSSGMHATAKFRWEYTTKGGKVFIGNFSIPYDNYSEKDRWAELCAKSDLGDEAFEKESLKLFEIANDKIR